MSDMFIDDNTHSYLSPKQVKGGVLVIKWEYAIHGKGNLPVCVKHLEHSKKGNKSLVKK